MDDLLDKLHEMRFVTIATMAGELAKDEGWAQWMTLLCQIQTSIQAIEALQEIEAEGEDCARGVPQAAQSARGA